MKLEGLDPVKLMRHFALEILLQGTRLSRSRFSLRQVCGLAEIWSGNGNEITIVTVTHLHSSHVLDY